MVEDPGVVGVGTAISKLLVDVTVELETTISAGIGEGDDGDSSTGAPIMVYVCSSVVPRTPRLATTVV